MPTELLRGRGYESSHGILNKDIVVVDVLQAVYLLLCFPLSVAALLPWMPGGCRERFRSAPWSRRQQSFMWKSYIAGAQALPGQIHRHSTYSALP
jgi:hypothetical protein